MNEKNLSYRINFLDRAIHIEIKDSISENPLKDALLKVDENEVYYLYFTKKILGDDKVIIHEVWHLFFDILSTFDGGNTSFVDLKKEIYTYAFETLFTKVKDGINKLC